MAYVTVEELAASNGAAQIGFEQDGLSAVPTQVQQELRFTIRPEQFGAQGDGVTDDASAINAAIAAANAAGGGVVALDARNYAVGSPILLQSKVALIGKGMRKTTITQIGTVAAWDDMVGAGGIVTTLSGGEYENVRVAGMTVRGIYSTPIADGASHYAKNGISLINIWNSSVEDCLVSDTATGIVMAGTVAGVADYNNLIARCVTYNARSWNAAGNSGAPRGITMATDRSTVRDTISDNCFTSYYVATDYGTYENCRASRWSDDGFYVNANYCEFTDCFAIGAASRAESSGSGFAVNPSTGHRFKGCVAIHCSNAGMRFRHAGMAAPSGNQVLGCLFKDCGYGFLDDLTSVQPYPQAVSRNNSFIGNMADGCQLNGFMFVRQQAGVISGNIAIANNQAGVTISNRGGIALAEYCLDNVVQGNICDDIQGTKTQAFGLYSYPSSVTGALLENTGNRIEHRSIYGVDIYFPSMQVGTASAAIASAARNAVGTVVFPLRFENAPVVIAGLQNGNALADGERPVSVSVYNVTATGFSFSIDALAAVAANRTLNIGWQASVR